MLASTPAFLANSPNHTNATNVKKAMPPTFVAFVCLFLKTAIYPYSKDSSDSC